jgi:phosphomannomutase
MYFIFDVDGTLTPSRGKMDHEFKLWFLNFIKQNPVALVTGSDLQKTLEQLGEDIVHSVEYSFNCSGNAIYKHGKLIYQSAWSCPSDLKEYLEEVLSNSKYTFRYGNHLENRIGMLNFSVVGRGAIGAQRDHYYHWDLQHQERASICKYINSTWDNVQAVVGGETGIDIFEKDCDKSQVLKYITDTDIHFFGDRMDVVGNDWPLGKVIIDKKLGSIYNIKNWEDTQRNLKFMESVGILN